MNIPIKNITFVVAYQSRDGTPFFFCGNSDYSSLQWTTNVMESSRFPTFDSAKNAQSKIEASQRFFDFTMCVITYDSVFDAFAEDFGDLLNEITNI